MAALRLPHPPADLVRLAVAVADGLTLTCPGPAAEVLLGRYTPPPPPPPAEEEAGAGAGARPGPGGEEAGGSAAAGVKTEAKEVSAVSVCGREGGTGAVVSSFLVKILGVESLVWFHWCLWVPVGQRLGMSSGCSVDAPAREFVSSQGGRLLYANEFGPGEAGPGGEARAQGGAGPGCGGGGGGGGRRRGNRHVRRCAGASSSPLAYTCNAERLPTFWTCVIRAKSVK